MSPVRVLTGELPGETNTSEDRVFAANNALIVLDGVTAVEPAKAGDGGWYADALGSRLVELLNADPAGHLPDLLEKAIWDIGASADLAPGRSPASTVAILRWNDAYVDGLVLGDSPIIIFRHDGSRDELRDERHDEVVDQVRRGHVSAADEAKLTIEERKALIHTTRAAKTARMNRPGGYWIAEATPEAAHHTLTRRWPRGELQAAIAATDGVSQGVDDYGVPPSWADALRMVSDKGAAALLQLIHAAEEDDPRGERWPRGKCHDDKAIAVAFFALEDE